MRLIAILLLLPALASAQSKMFVPAWTSDSHGSTLDNGLILYCAKVVPEASITNATKMAGYSESSACSDSLTFAIYSDTAPHNLIASATGPACGGVVKQSGLTAFSLTAGTPVWNCVCGTSISLNYMGIQQNTTCCEEYSISQLLQSFNPANLGTGNACTLGTAAPPATMGTITPDATSPGHNQKKILFVAVEQ